MPHARSLLPYAGGRREIGPGAPTAETLRAVRWALALAPPGSSVRVRQDDNGAWQWQPGGDGPGEGTPPPTLAELRRRQAAVEADIRRDARRQRYEAPWRSLGLR